jgi:hypothetical protein
MPQPIKSAACTRLGSSPAGSESRPTGTGKRVNSIAFATRAASTVGEFPNLSCTNSFERSI